jgi:hypothetical protein
VVVTTRLKFRSAIRAARVANFRHIASIAQVTSALLDFCVHLVLRLFYDSVSATSVSYHLMENCAIIMIGNLGRMREYASVASFKFYFYVPTVVEEKHGTLQS